MADVEEMETKKLSTFFNRRACRVKHSVKLGKKK